MTPTEGESVEYVKPCTLNLVDCIGRPQARADRSHDILHQGDCDTSSSARSYNPLTGSRPVERQLGRDPRFRRSSSIKPETKSKSRQSSNARSGSLRSRRHRLPHGGGAVWPTVTHSRSVDPFAQKNDNSYDVRSKNAGQLTSVGTGRTTVVCRCRSRSANRR